MGVARISHVTLEGRFIITKWRLSLVLVALLLVLVALLLVLVALLLISSSTAPYKPSTSSAICANDDNIPADATASSTDSGTMSLLAVLGKLRAPKPSELSRVLNSYSRA